MPSCLIISNCSSNFMIYTTGLHSDIAGSLWRVCEHSRVGTAPQTENNNWYINQQRKRIKNRQRRFGFRFKKLKNERKGCHHQNQKRLENLGIDPSTSRMLSERSTIWASPPNTWERPIFYSISTYQEGYDFKMTDWLLCVCSVWCCWQVPTIPNTVEYSCHTFFIYLTLLSLKSLSLPTHQCQCLCVMDVCSGCVVDIPCRIMADGPMISSQNSIRLWMKKVV